MAMMVLFASLLALCGMLGLCLGLARHYQQVLKRPPRPRLGQGLRALGWASLAGSCAACVAAWGWGMGSIAWFGLVGLAGLGVAMALPYAAKWLER